MNTGKTSLSLHKRVFEIIEVGASGDLLSRSYDLPNTRATVIYLAASILFTF